jgi:hypothetical protein
VNIYSNVMSLYSFRNNHFIEEENIRAKLVFKTKEVDWLATKEPAVILISIHSAFHAAVDGRLKMDAFVSTIKNRVKGPLILLFADIAHAKTMSLCQPLEKCLQDAEALSAAFPCFEGCTIKYWHSYIGQDESYKDALKMVRLKYEQDSSFRESLHADAVKSGDDSEPFIKMAIEDIIEQCAALLVLSNKGYRYLFYPGHPYSSYCYLENDLSWIHVFLAIERKKKSKG